MFRQDALKYAKAIAIDDKDATRIANKACSLYGVCRRDDVRIVKNGEHNMFWFYMLDSNAFPAWIVDKASRRSDELGIYIAKRISKKADVYERLALAADVGRIPRDLQHIAVVRTTSADKAMSYIERAKEKLGVDIAVIHDESGRFNDECLIRSDEFKYVKIPESMSENGQTKIVRFTGLTPDMDEDIPQYYQHEATLYAGMLKEGLFSFVFRTFGGAARGTNSRAYVEALSCGHESMI